MHILHIIFTYIHVNTRKTNGAGPQIVLKLPQGHEDSEYVLSFEIGQRERGFYSERTESQSDRAIQYRIII